MSVYDRKGGGSEQKVLGVYVTSHRAVIEEEGEQGGWREGVVRINRRVVCIVPLTVVISEEVTAGAIQTLALHAMGAGWKWAARVYHGSKQGRTGGVLNGWRFTGKSVWAREGVEGDSMGREWVAVMLASAAGAAVRPRAWAGRGRGCRV